MSTPPARRPGRTAASKQKLFDATLRLVASTGLAAVTVDEIAAEAGVAKGTVYYNFGSKDALIEALLRHGVSLLAGKLHEADSAPAEHSLEYLVDGALTFIEEYPGFAQLLVGELWRTTGQWHDTLTVLREEIISIVKGQLRRSAAAGRLPGGTEAGTAAAALFGTVLVLALDWQVFHPQRPRTEVHAGVMRLVRGLAPATAAPNPAPPNAGPDSTDAAGPDPTSPGPPTPGTAKPESREA